MKLTKTSEYSIRILSFMAITPEEKFSAKELVNKLKISDKYLRKLMIALAKAGFIRSKQGRDGGYCFAKPISEIFISQIIDAVEGLDKYMGCVMGFDECSDENPCALHSQWAGVRNDIFKMFENTSLEKMAKSNVHKY